MAQIIQRLLAGVEQLPDDTHFYRAVTRVS